jgi:nitrogen fixation protein NifU and related proteins
MNTEQFDYILDHFKNPRNYKRISEPDISYEEGNPLCGDVIRFDLKIKNNKVSETGFSGKGCAISQASASILTEMIMNNDLESIREITADDLLEAIGMRISPVRLKCALLSLKVLKSGLFGKNNWPGEE